MPKRTVNGSELYASTPALDSNGALLVATTTIAAVMRAFVMTYPHDQISRR